MSTQPPPPQGAYGPPHPGPYGTAPGPYGLPPPFGQQPPPQQAWPPVAPPPPKSSTGAKVAGIVLACVLGLVLVAGGLVFALAGGGSSSGDASAYDGPTYTLRLPDTLLDGTYTRGRDLSDKLAATRPANGGAYAEQVHYTGAVYTPSTGEARLMVTGFSSTMEIPTYPHHGILDGMESGPGTTVAIARREFTPNAGEDPLACEVLAKDKSGLHLVMAVCSWTDGHTQAVVTETRTGSASAVDLTAYAQKSADVRSEVRVPADS